MKTTSILVVEDDIITAMLLSNILESLNYHITTVTSGEAAQKELLEAQTNQTPYTVVITDLHMEEVDGIQVLQHARQQEPPAEVIVLTGFGSLASAIDALRAGAYAYLLKPCKVAELIACVSSAVQQVHTFQFQTQALQQMNEMLNDVSTSIQPHDGTSHSLNRSLKLVVPEESNIGIFQHGPLRLDRFRDVVWFNEKEIALTPTEYMILDYLLERQGRVISYQEIVRHTHGYDTTNAEAQGLLKAHIYHLRRKTDPTYVVNIRGVGYMLAIGPTRILMDTPIHDDR